MTRMLTCGLAIALFVTSVFAQSPWVVPGNRLFVEDTPFGHAIAAAIVKKKVPVTVTLNKEQADFMVAENSEASKEGTGERVAKVIAFGVFAGSGKSFEATVTVSNPAGDVAFSYNVKKSNFQSAAEAFAKHLGEHVKNAGKRR
jgi:hypothetical protein